MKLLENNEKDSVARRHAEYFRALLERDGGETCSLSSADWLRLYGPQVDDVRAALDWAFSLKERIVEAATGPAGLMEMAHFDIGEVLRKELGNRAPKSARLVIGNPLIMKEMVKHVPDAASYAPVTVLIDERADGVHMSYDLMASFLAPYGNAQASAVAAQLDEKIVALLTAAAE